MFTRVIASMTCRKRPNGIRLLMITPEYGYGRTFLVYVRLLPRGISKNTVFIPSCQSNNDLAIDHVYRTALSCSIYEHVRAAFSSPKEENAHRSRRRIRDSRLGTCHRLYDISQPGRFQTCIVQICCLPLSPSRIITAW